MGPQLYINPDECISSRCSTAYSPQDAVLRFAATRIVKVTTSVLDRNIQTLLFLLLRDLVVQVGVIPAEHSIQRVLLVFSFGEDMRLARVAHHACFAAKEF